jgi:uncharacterized protein (TIGR02452 family)
MSQPNNSNKNTNIYPERRRKREQEQTEITLSSKPSEKMASDERKDGNPNKKRQAVLSMNAGQLTTKRGLVNPQASDDPRRAPLKDIAVETISLLPGLLATRPDVSTEGRLCNAADVLDTKYCPGLRPIKVRVISSDTIDAALDLIRSPYGKPCILNMANATSAGGGFKHGALAQEEALCYRTSLYRTLKIKHYPMGDREGIYSPDVMVIRESMKNGHGLVDLREPKHLAVISAVSVAAVCQPSISSTVSGMKKYSNDADRRLMTEKIRLMLRMTIRHKHTQVVLGAFGCGAFGNPREEVANMFAKVLLETEFQGGWWDDVVFAVLDDGRGPNFKVFHAALDGLVV